MAKIYQSQNYSGIKRYKQNVIHLNLHAKINNVSVLCEIPICTVSYIAYFNNTRKKFALYKSWPENPDEKTTTVFASRDMNESRTRYRIKDNYTALTPMQ